MSGGNSKQEWTHNKWRCIMYLYFYVFFFLFIFPHFLSFFVFRNYGYFVWGEGIIFSHSTKLWLEGSCSPHRHFCLPVSSSSINDTCPFKSSNAKLIGNSVWYFMWGMENESRNSIFYLNMGIYFRLMYVQVWLE